MLVLRIPFKKLHRFFLKSTFLETALSSIGITFSKNWEPFLSSWVPVASCCMPWFSVLNGLPHFDMKFCSWLTHISSASVLASEISLWGEYWHSSSRQQISHKIQLTVTFRGAWYFNSAHFLFFEFILKFWKNLCGLVILFLYSLVQRNATFTSTKVE